MFDNILTNEIPDLPRLDNATLYNRLDHAKNKLTKLKRIPKQYLKPDEINQFHQEVIEIWREYLTEQLAFEPHPLALIESLCDITDHHPLSFAALILFLIDRGVSNDDILNSGLLHHYFAINLIEKDNILFTYHLLRLFPEAEDLIDQASVINTLYSTSLRLLKTETEEQKEAFDALEPTTLFFTLTGTLKSKSDLICIPTTTPALTWAPTQKNIHLLHALFGNSLLLRAFSFLEKNPKLSLKRTLRQTLTHFTLDDIKALYHAIQDEVGQDIRTQCLVQLTDIIPDETIDVLFKQYETPEKKTSVSPWILLNTKPKLLRKTTPQDLEHLIENYPIESHEIDHIASLTQNTEMAPFRTHFHLSIFSHFMENPTLINHYDDHDDEVHVNLERQLFEDQNITSACQATAIKLQATLQQHILENIEPFTYDSFINITTYHHQNRARYMLLHRLSQTFVDLPKTNYQLYAYILATNIDLQEALNNIHAHLEPANIRQAHIRTLLETLCFVNHPELQARIIALLNTNFGIKNWKEQKLANKTPFEQALEHGNESLLTTYFSDQEFETLNQAMLNRHKDSLNERFANNKRALSILLKRLPMSLQDMQTALHHAIPHPEALRTLLANALETGIALDNLLTFTLPLTDDTYFHDLVSYPASLRVLLNYISNTEATFFLDAMLCEVYQKIPLFIAVDYPESLRLIFNKIPKKERFLILKTKDRHHNNLLHAASNQAKSFELLLNLHTNSEVRLEAINQPNNIRETPLWLAARARTPNTLRLAMACFPDDSSRLSATHTKNNQGDTLLHLAINHAESFLYLLELYPEEQQLDALFDLNENGETPLHNVAQHPEIFATVLDNLSETILTQIRLPQGPLNQSLLHSPALPFASVELLLDLYPNPAERSYAIMHTDVYNKTPLDYAIERKEPAHFRRFIDVYDKTHRLAIINTVDHETGQTLFHDSPEESIFIPTVLESLLPPERLTALTTKNKQQETPLHLMVKGVKPNALIFQPAQSDLDESKKKRTSTLEKALNTLRQEDKITVVNQHDQKGNTPLHYAVTKHNERQWEVILNSLPDSDIFTAVSATNKQRLTPLHLAATEYGTLFTTTFERLSHVEQASIATIEDSRGNLLLHHVANMKAHLDLVLRSYASSTERLTALQTENIQGYTAWRCMEYAQISQNVVQSLLSEEDWLTLNTNSTDLRP